MAHSIKPNTGRFVLLQAAPSDHQFSRKTCGSSPSPIRCIVTARGGEAAARWSRPASQHSLTVWCSVWSLCADTSCQHLHGLWVWHAELGFGTTVNLSQHSDWSACLLRFFIYNKQSFSGTVVQATTAQLTVESISGLKSILWIINTAWMSLKSELMFKLHHKYWFCNKV